MPTLGFPVYYPQIGPRPFSSMHLPYYSKCILDLMEGIWAANDWMGDPHTAFWSYDLLENPDGWVLQQKTLGNLEGDLVWTTRKYAQADLAPVHHHGKPVGGVVPEDWTVQPLDPSDDISVEGRTLAGNLIEQIRIALWKILKQYRADATGGGTPSSWIYIWETQFKELSPNPIWHHPQKRALWTWYGETKYNLLTDHIEALRMWPRSVVNYVGVDGVVYQVDGRLRDTGGDDTGKVGKVLLFLDADKGPYTPVDPVAFLEASPPVLVEQSALVTYDGTSWHRYPLSMPGTLTDATHGHGGGVMGVLDDGRLVAMDPTGIQATYRTTAPPDSLSYVGNKIQVGPVRDYTIKPDGIEHMGGDRYAVIDNGGSIITLDSESPSSFRVKHRITIPLSGQGLCLERTGALLKEGPDYSYGFLVGEGRGQIHALACYPGAFGVADFADGVALPGYNNPGAITTPVSMFYREGGKALDLIPIGRDLHYGLPIPEDLTANSYRFEKYGLEQVGNGARVHALFSSLAQEPGVDPDRPNAFTRADFIHFTWTVPSLSEFRKKQPVTVAGYPGPVVMCDAPQRTKFGLPLTKEFTYRPQGTGAVSTKYDQFLEHITVSGPVNYGKNTVGGLTFMIVARYGYPLLGPRGVVINVFYYDDQDINEWFPYDAFQIAWVAQGALVDIASSGVKLERASTLQDRIDGTGRDPTGNLPTINPGVGPPIIPMRGTTFYTNGMCGLTVETRADIHDFWLVVDRGAWPCSGLGGQGVAWNGLGS